MREVAEAAGISKSLLYHYFPSKTELFKAAVQVHAEELQGLIEPSGEGNPAEELARRLDAYLGWIEANKRTWASLMQSAATISEARDVAENFRERTLAQILRRLTAGRAPRPALRAALKGWLGYIDAAIVDWIQTDELTREQLHALLVAAFGATVVAAQQADPSVEVRLA